MPSKRTPSKPRTRPTTIRSAWRIYLRETKTLFGAQYEEVEVWAWTQLEQDLTRLRR